MRMIPIALSLLLTSPADAGRKKKKADPMAATCSTMTEAGIAANTGNVFLRSAFDTDPSMYLGRFVPVDTADIDDRQRQHPRHRR